MMYDMEHIFICLFAICVSSLVKSLSRFLVNFKNQVVCFLTVNLFLYNKRGQFVELRQRKNKVKVFQLYDCSVPVYHLS